MWNRRHGSLPSLVSIGRSGQDWRSAEAGGEQREQLAREVRSLLKNEGITALLVTHDQYEAFALADTIGVMDAGCMLQWATAFDLYHRPADRFIADFIGQGVFVCGVVVGDGLLETELGSVSGEMSWRCCKPFDR